MVKYMTKFDCIEQVEVERESENSVWIDGRRSSKMTSYECYFDTFEQAKDYLISELLKDIRSAQTRVARLTERLERVQRLIP